MKKVFGNLGIRIGALLITVFICLNAETARMVEVTCTVPVEYVNVPDSLVLVGGAVDNLQVRAAFSRRFWQTRPDYLTARIDLSRVKRGTERIAASPDMIQVPPDRKARAIEIVAPDRILLTFEPKVRRRVPVVPPTAGAPAEGHGLLGKAKAEPARVYITGPEGSVEAIREVATLPLLIEGASEDVRATRSIDLSAHPLVRSEPAEVEVAADIERIEDRVLQRRPVRVSPAETASIEPGAIDLVVRGPASAGALLQEERTRVILNVASLPAGSRVFAVEVVERNRLHFFAPTVSLDRGSGAGHESHPEFFAEVQNLTEPFVLVEVSPKTFTITRGGG